MRYLSGIYAALAASTALAPLPAMGQATAVQDDLSGTIVVTARRREESLLDVPIAITAISGEMLERTGALDITSISETAPNVTLEVSRGTNTTLTAFIRGVGQQDPVAGFEAGVGLYLDDVYLNRPQAAVLDIYDVERIEVLRGPQGTLYGRNTIGGAVKYVTRKLDADPMLRLRGTLGTDEQAEFVATASAPVGDGTLRFGGSIARLSRGGFGKNLTTGDDNYNKDVWAGRLSAEVHADDFFVRLSGDYTKDKSNPRGGHRLIPGLVSGIPVLDDVYDSRGGLDDPKQEVEAWGGALFIEATPSDAFTMRSITSYRKDDSGTPIDFDALPAVDVDVPAIYNNRQFSQELQLLYDQDSFSGMVGAYFLDANAETAFDVRLPGGVTALTFGDVDTKTFALFGDATYDFTEQWSLSVGARYTWDKRESTILRQVFLGGGSPFFAGSGTLFATTSDFSGKETFKEFTPRASLSFKPTPDHTLYGSYSKGFKGGGFDPRGVSTAAPDLDGDGQVSYDEIFDFISFQPEKVDSFELGWKASLFDRRVNLGLAAFHADYKDVQVPGSVGAMIDGQQTFIGVTTNAGKARIRGVEFEGNARVAEGLANAQDAIRFNWALGYIDAKYKQFIDARGIDVADRRKFQNTPKWTASGTLGYEIPLAAGDLYASTTLSYRSKTYQFEVPAEGLDQSGYALWDASIVWTSGDERLSIGIHGKNLLDKQYIVSGYNFISQDPDSGAYIRNAAGSLIPTLGAEGVLTAYYGNPRQVFATIGYRF